MISLPRLFAITALLAVACGETVTSTVEDAGNDLGPVDVPRDPMDAGPDAVTVDARPDAPPDDVDQGCANNAVDRCLNHPPGPCRDLADGTERVVRFAGFARDITLSCATRTTATGPDAVLPLTIRRSSDVSLTVAPGAGDTVTVAIAPANGCGDPRGELACENGGFTIGGISVVSVGNLPPGDYVVIVGTVRGVDARVSAVVTPARERGPGDLCPGVTVTPDGPGVSIDTRRFHSVAEYGTTCGYNASRGLGWVDAVFTFTTTAVRDVTVSVAGDGEEDVNLEVSSVCGSAAFVVPGCDTGLPVSRTLRNLPPGTYWATVDYRPLRRPDHTLTATVRTAPPTPPGPATRCPGVVAPENTAVVLDVDTLIAGPALACLPRQRAGAFMSFTAPTEPGDVLMHVINTDARADAGLVLRRPCDGDVIGACIGPGDRSANNLWVRYQGLTPGETYTVQAATSSSGGQLSTRWLRIPTATPEAVTGNVTCASAHVIPAAGGVFTGSTDSATAVATPYCASSSAGCAGSRGVLYRLTLTERRRVIAILDGMGFDALVAVMTGDVCPGRSSMMQASCNDDWYSTDSQVDVTLNAGTYWIHAGGCGTGQSGPYQLDVMVIPPSS